MREGFKNYLIIQGYSEYTAKGTPSTVYDYIKRIDFVCEQEACNWLDLSSNINQVICDYDKGGVKERLSDISHRAVINALKRFKDFLYFIKFNI